MNMGTTRLRGKRKNRWQDEVRDYCIVVSEEVWQGRIYKIEEWKKLLRTARNRRILHTSMNEPGGPCRVCNGVPKLRNATVRLSMPIPLSVCSSAMKKLSRNLFGFFETFT